MSPDLGIPSRSLEGGQGASQLKRGVHSTPRQGALDGLVSADMEALGKMVSYWPAGQPGSSGPEGGLDQTAHQWLRWPEVVHHVDPLIVH